MQRGAADGSGRGRSVGVETFAEVPDWTCFPRIELFVTWDSQSIHDQFGGPSASLGLLEGLMKLIYAALASRAIGTRQYRHRLI